MAYSAPSPGSGWKFLVQDKGSPGVTIKIIVPEITLSTPSDPDRKKVFFDDPIPADGGIDVVTFGSTPGVLNVWLTLSI
jgi:hypothetical protein